MLNAASNPSLENSVYNLFIWISLNDKDNYVITSGDKLTLQYKFKKSVYWDGTGMC